MHKDEAEGGGAETRADLWRLWRDLKTLFPAWSLIPSGVYTPGAWGYVGVDFLSGFRRNPSTIRAFDLLQGTDAATFDALSALASLNVRRHEQMTRAVIVGYLTLPLSVVALAAQLAGNDVVGFIRAAPVPIFAAVAILGLGPLGYLMGLWRARQIIGVLDLIRIERGQAPFTALELRDE